MRKVGLIVFLIITQNLFSQRQIIEPEIDIFCFSIDRYYEISNIEKVEELYNDAYVAIYYNNNFDEAIKSLLQALKLENDFFHALGILGIIYAKLNLNDNVKEIEDRFIELIKNNNSDKKLYYLLALIYDEQKMYIKAIDLLNQLYKLESINDYVFVHYNIGKLYFEIKDYQKAYEYLNIATKRFVDDGYFPQKYESSCLLGITCSHLKKYDEALLHFQFILEDTIFGYRDPAVEYLIEIIQEKIK